MERRSPYLFNRMAYWYKKPSAMPKGQKRGKNKEEKRWINCRNFLVKRRAPGGKGSSILYTHSENRSTGGRRVGTRRGYRLWRVVNRYIKKVFWGRCGGWILHRQSRTTLTQMYTYNIRICRKNNAKHVDISNGSYPKVFSDCVREKIYSIRK